jgi:hypothetical protein
MLFQLFQRVVNHSQRFQSPVRRRFGRSGKLGCDLLPGIGYDSN